MKLPSDADRSGRNLGKEELSLLRRVITSGRLTSTGGTMVREFEKRFAAWFGVEFCRATSSGTASIHTAVAAVDPEPGDEIITSPITDMGAIAPIVYQTGVPVFADVDPLTFNITAETIRPRITPRTKAIIVTHLFGNPCRMEPIMELARLHRIPVIEDAAQAYLAEYRGKLVGTIGDIGCFSLQQTKHITCGEGGIVISNNRHYARRMKLFIDKAWGYGDPKPDHYFLALNYRMTELQGAVALAQLEKLEDAVQKRIRRAEMLTKLITNIAGITPQQVSPGCKHSYWRYALRVDKEIIKGGVDSFASELIKKGISCAPRYIKKPAFMCQVFRELKTFGTSRFPFLRNRDEEQSLVPYRWDDFPGTTTALSTMVVIRWNEFYTEKHVEFIARCIKEAARKLSNKTK